MSIHRLTAILLFLLVPVVPGLFGKDQAPAPIAEVGGIKISESEMKLDIGSEVYEAEANLYQLKKNWIDQKARTILFEDAAKKAGLSLEDWQHKEIEEKVEQPSEENVREMAQRIIRQQNPGAQPDAAKLAQAEPQAREVLTRQMTAQRANAVYQELLKKQPLKILLKKPELPKVNVTFSLQDPSSGSEKAPVTIVAFSDFQCSYCRRGHETMKEILDAYPGKIRLVQREFPLSFHKRARAAAEAALCAKDQGQFWTYADKLFANQQKLEDADLQKYAAELKLNAGEFGQCVSAHKYGEQIDRDMVAGEGFGVHGTPAYFVNGRFLSGAQPFESFKEVIDEELARKK
jgi:protein-disulfide isomerase